MQPGPGGKPILKLLRTQTVLVAQRLGQLIERTIQILVELPLLINFIDGVEDGRVVLASELAADFGQRSFRQMLGQVHGDLPRKNDLARVVLGLDLRQTKPELLRHRLLDALDRDLARLLVDEVLEHLLGSDQVDDHAGERGISQQPDERAFQFANEWTSEGELTGAKASLAQATTGDTRGNVSVEIIPFPESNLEKKFTTTSPGIPPEGCL